ncbi:MAG: hypothetical protein WA432_03820 [Candidatus Babeliaceae bacterium]
MKRIIPLFIALVSVNSLYSMHYQDILENALYMALKTLQKNAGQGNMTDAIAFAEWGRLISNENYVIEDGAHKKRLSDLRLITHQGTINPIYREIVFEERRKE